MLRPPAQIVKEKEGNPKYFFFKQSVEIFFNYICIAIHKHFLWWKE